MRTASSPRRVLLVEDSPTRALRSREVLTARGYVVEVVGDGVEALEALERSTPDVVISDLLMPRLDGFELCRAIRRDPGLRHVPVLLRTAAFVLPSDRELALAVGADGYVSDTDEEALVAALDEAVTARADAPPGPPLAEEEFHGRHLNRFRDLLLRNLEELQSAYLRMRHVAELSQEALADDGADTLLAAASARVAAVLDVPGIGVLDRVEDGWWLVAGAGWPAEPGLLDLDLDAGAGAVPAALGELGAATWCSTTVHVTDAPERRLVALLPAGRDLTGDEERFLASVANLLATAGARAAAEEARRAGEALMAELVARAPCPIYVKDRSGRYLFVNERMEELAGRDPSSMLGRRDDELFPPATARRMRAEDELLLEGEPAQEAEERVETPDGPRWYAATRYPLVDGDGAIRATAGIALDVTDRRQAADYRAALVSMLLRRHEAIEWNDTVVQGLVVAQALLDLGDVEQARHAVTNTLDAAMTLVSRMLEESAVAPGDLVRTAPAGTAAVEAR
jgi:PAS domain S-box-containing protein